MSRSINTMPYFVQVYAKAGRRYDKDEVEHHANYWRHYDEYPTHADYVTECAHPAQAHWAAIAPRAVSKHMGRRRRSYQQYRAERHRAQRHRVRRLLHQGEYDRAMSVCSPKDADWYFYD